MPNAVPARSDRRMRRTRARGATVRAAAFAMLRLLAAAALLAATGIAHADGEPLVVFAAASLKNALDEVDARFERESGRRTVASYAASSALARQIEAGAPADVFISADLDWMDYLDSRGLIRPVTRTRLLGNQLVLVGPADHPAAIEIGPGFPLSAALRSGRLAMADPNSVPAGKYGRAALESLGVWNTVSARIAPAESVRAALLLVSRGEAPLGIVYRTDAVADPGVRIAGRFPPDSHPPIVYPAAVTTGSKHPGAMAYMSFLGSAAAGSAFEKQGFTLLR